MQNVLCVVSWCKNIVSPPCWNRRSCDMWVWQIMFNFLSVFALEYIFHIYFLKYFYWGFHILLQLTCMNITMHHCYIIREHGRLYVWCIEYLLCCVFEPANFESKGSSDLWLGSHLQRLKVQIHLPNGDVRPGNLKPSHVLASRVAGLQDCATSPG